MASEGKVLAVAGVRRTARELVDGTIRVQIDIEPRHRKDFYELLGEIDTHVALAPLRPEAATQLTSNSQIGGEEPISETEAGVRGPNLSNSSEHESLAARLHRTGYFRNPKLWRALHDNGVYTVQQHKEYVKTLPCHVKNVKCQGEVCLHHCQSSALPAAGPELQPENPAKVPHWYGVPLCHHHHRNWVHGSGPGCADREQKQRLVMDAVELMAGQAKKAMKRYMGIESLKGINGYELAQFEEDMGLAHAS